MEIIILYIMKCFPLQELRQKLAKVQKVENELRAHLQNLPDISKLPNIKTGGLAPLPSAGDLFT